MIIASPYKKHRRSFAAVLFLTYSSAKSIVQYNLDGSFVAEWEAISDAARALNINVSNITQCCLGKRKTAGNYIWKYKEVL